jgi:outer membrane protein OmpA-like peptidoglycan-associated protein
MCIRRDYLPEVFTIEFDMYMPMGTTDEIGMNSNWIIRLRDAADKEIFSMDITNNRSNENVPRSVDWNWLSGGGSNRGETDYLWKYNDFNRISISFNQRALKVYLNETRVVNIPRCDAPTKFEVYAYQGGEELRLIKNVRIAKGAVPLYDRMMSEGKFITYGITFDLGKSSIKPESMGEINRIVQLMTENPDLKFSVEGHTDSTGNSASNQTLSEARSKAIVDKLVSLGITSDRLSSSGKGQNNPIADNGTDEGRAKNRRVEFVKK